QPGRAPARRRERWHGLLELLRPGEPSAALERTWRVAAGCHPFARRDHGLPAPARLAPPRGLTASSGPSGEAVLARGGGREQGGEVAREFALREDRTAAVAARGQGRLDVLVVDEAERADKTGSGIRGEEVEGAERVRTAQVEDHELRLTCRRDHGLGVASARGIQP